jgi:hypothetical protein
MLFRSRIKVADNVLRVCAVFTSQNLINTDNERIRTKQSKSYGKNSV